jgi:hypothetical protein
MADLSSDYPGLKKASNQYISRLRPPYRTARAGSCGTIATLGDVLSYLIEHMFIRLAGVSRDQTPRSQTIDERIANLDVARENLAAAVTAIDELKAEAEQNKGELSSALQRLRMLEIEKATAEQELASLRQIASADMAVFQKLVGIPSRRDIVRERLVGFLLGLLASLAASILWWLFTSYHGGA